MVVDIIAQFIMYGGFFYILYKVWSDFKVAVESEPSSSLPGPQIFSSLGVLGTFVGITYSLITFDPGHLESSVPTLLSGMRLAFITSIVGMAGSLLMKRYQKKKIKERGKAIIAGSTIDDVLKCILEYDTYTKQRDQQYFELARENNEILKSTIQESLDKMTKSLVGDGEATLIGQIKFLRSDFNDNHRELKELVSTGNNEMIAEFRNFAAQMAENNNKAFIEALNESMKDLNIKLQEQFGENFKELNIAVGRLLEWQENYKQTIEIVTKNQREVLQGIDMARHALIEIADRSRSIQDSAERLTHIILTMEQYEQRLKSSMEELGLAADRAHLMIPEIDQYIRSSIDNVENQVNTVSSSFSDLGKSTVEIVNTLMKKVEATNSNVETTVQSAIANIEKAVVSSTKQIDEQINDTMIAFNDLKEVYELYLRTNQESIDKQIKSIEAAAVRLEADGRGITQRVSDNIQALVEDNNKALKDSTENIRKQLEATLNDSLKSLGIQLASLSEKFAKDYTPLTDRLRDVVEISRRIGQVK